MKMRMMIADDNDELALSKSGSCCQAFNISADRKFLVYAKTEFNRILEQCFFSTLILNLKSTVFNVFSFAKLSNTFLY